MCLGHKRTMSEVLAVVIVQHQQAVQCKKFLSTVEFNQSSVEQYCAERPIGVKLSCLEVQKVHPNVCKTLARVYH